MSEPSCSPTANTVVTCSNMACKSHSDIHFTAAQKATAPFFNYQKGPATLSRNEESSTHYNSGLNSLLITSTDSESNTRPAQSGEHLLDPDPAEDRQSKIQRLTAAIGDVNSYNWTKSKRKQLKKKQPIDFGWAVEVLQLDGKVVTAEYYHDSNDRQVKYKFLLSNEAMAESEYGKAYATDRLVWKEPFQYCAKNALDHKKNLKVLIMFMAFLHHPKTMGDEWPFRGNQELHENRLDKVVGFINKKDCGGVQHQFKSKDTAQDHSDKAKLQYQCKHDLMSAVKNAEVNPAFFSCQMDLDRGSIFHKLLSFPVLKTTQEQIDRCDIAVTVSYLSVPRWNPRNHVVPRVYTSENLAEWIWFLKKHRTPVFLWEYMAYKNMLNSLAKMGVGIDGGLIKLVTLKKQSFDSERQIPFESFQILDVEKAKPWIMLPERCLGDSEQSLEEWTAQLLRTASKIEAWPTQHTDVIVNNMMNAQYSTYGLEDHLNDYMRAIVKAAVPKLMRSIGNQVWLRANGEIPIQPLPEPVKFRDSASDCPDADEDEDLDMFIGDQWNNPFYILRTMWIMKPEWTIQQLPDVTYYNQNKPTIEYVHLVLQQEQLRQPRIVRMV